MAAIVEPGVFVLHMQENYGSWLIDALLGRCPSPPSKPCALSMPTIRVCGYSAALRYAAGRMVGCLVEDEGSTHEGRREARVLNVKAKSIRQK